MVTGGLSWTGILKCRHMLHIHTQTHTHTHTHTHTNTHIHTHSACTHVHTHAHTHTHTHARIKVHIITQDTRACTHLHTQTHKHVHIHTQHTHTHSGREDDLGDAGWFNFLSYIQVSTSIAYSCGNCTESVPVRPQGFLYAAHEVHASTTSCRSFLLLL